MEESDEADGQVTQGGHDLWAVAGAQLVAVLIEDHVPDPVETVFYPVTLLVVPGVLGLGQLLWARVSCPCLLMIRG